MLTVSDIQQITKSATAAAGRQPGRMWYSYNKLDGSFMRSLPRLFVLCVLCVVTPAFAANRIYRYTDESGTLTFTNELQSIPEKYRSRAVPLESDIAPTVGVVTPNRPTPLLRVVTASGEYRMGDHDTRSDAVRLAIEAAKRQVLEQVATYLESVTEVKNLDVTRDDIRTYTAGIVMVLGQQISTRIEDGTVVIHADLTAQVDQNEVIQAIAALREDESAKQELVALRTETDELRQQLDAANQALAAAESPEQVQALTLQRQQLLNQMQADALVSQAWTDWVYVRPIIYPYPVGVRQVSGLLLQAKRLHPTNQHLHAVQQVVTAQGGTLPPPPVGESAPPPHASLLVPPPVPQYLAPPQQTIHPTESTRLPAPTLMNPPVSPLVNPPVLPLMNPPVSPLLPMLPPTIQQVHPPHLAQPNPPVPRAPFSAPLHVPSQSHRPGRESSGGGGQSGGHPGH